MVLLGIFGSENNIKYFLAFRLINFRAGVYVQSYLREICVWMKYCVYRNRAIANFDGGRAFAILLQMTIIAINAEIACGRGVSNTDADKRMGLDIRFDMAQSRQG